MKNKNQLQLVNSSELEKLQYKRDLLIQRNVKKMICVLYVMTLKKQKLFYSVVILNIVLNVYLNGLLLKLHVLFVEHL